MTELLTLINKIKQCHLCDTELPYSAKPVVQLDARAKILIAGQAPGLKAHLSGVPFDDASGQRLRQWLGLSSEQFYDQTQLAILPMGFCFPGSGNSGDLPPSVRCAATWRAEVLSCLPELELTIMLGKYAQDYHLGKSAFTVTSRVKRWQETLPQSISLPHPSGRNNIWLKRNPWFEEQVLPALRERVAQVLVKKQFES